MPLTSGAVTCRIYRVADPPRGDFIEGALRDLRRHAFRAVAADRGQDRSMGWVNPRNVLDAELTPDKVRFGDYLVLGLRIDKITVNARILKARFQQAAEEMTAAREKKRLLRDERDALMERVRQEILSEQTPSTSLYEMAWDLESHVVYFSGTGESLNVEFADLFQETFHAGLILQVPYTRAQRHAAAQGQTEELENTRPARFRRGGAVRAVFGEEG